MRNLSPAFTASLASGATTLCYCWRLIPRDGAALGFTDHDRDLTFDNMVFSATTGLESSALESKLGFAVGGGEVAGALASASLDEADLASGRYDGASLEIWRVDWSNPAARLLIDLATIGEVRRSEFAFTAEVRSIAHELDEPRGRLFQAGCSADLGDSKCGVNLAALTLRAQTAVSQTDGRVQLTANVAGFDEGWFGGGTLVFTSGANAGLRGTIKSHRQNDATAIISLWTPTAHLIATGDAITLNAGCDKAFTTCRVKFANQTSYRGFPHMPGNDVVMSYPNAGDPRMDGGSLLR